MKFAISVLQKAAFELAGEILTLKATQEQIKTTDELAQMAHKLLFGGFISESEQAKQKEYLELLEAIRVLREYQDANR